MNWTKSPGRPATTMTEFNIWRVCSYISVGVGVLTFFVAQDTSEAGMLFAYACFWYLVANREEAKHDSAD